MLCQNGVSGRSSFPAGLTSGATLWIKKQSILNMVIEVVKLPDIYANCAVYDNIWLVFIFGIHTNEVALFQRKECALIDKVVRHVHLRDSELIRKRFLGYLCQCKPLR